MKAKKALKRLTKIEALMSDVTERFPNTSLQIQGALKDAKAAFARLKEAVSLQVSSETANDSKAPSRQTPETINLKPGVGRVAQKSEATANTEQSKKKAGKTMVAKTRASMTAKKRAPIKKVGQETAAPKETAQAPVEIPATVETETATVETAPADVEAQTEHAAQMSVGQ